MSKSQQMRIYRQPEYGKFTAPLLRARHYNTGTEKAWQTWSTKLPAIHVSHTHPNPPYYRVEYRLGTGATTAPTSLIFTGQVKTGSKREQITLHRSQRASTNNSDYHAIPLRIKTNHCSRLPLCFTYPIKTTLQGFFFQHEKFHDIPDV